MAAKLSDLATGLRPEISCPDLNIVRRDACSHFRNKTKAYMKAKVEELETNSKRKKYQALE
jgi:hypothetical protein